MYKILLLFTVLILTITTIYGTKQGCSNNTKHTKYVDIELNYMQIEQKNNKSLLPENYLVAYENNIPVLNSLSVKADTIGYLKDLEVVERFTSFYYPNGVLAESDNQNSFRYPIKYNNDTGWIDRNENVSLIYYIDTIDNLVFKNVFDFGEIGGIGYQKSLVYNLKTQNLVLSRSLKLDYCFELNDSLFLFNGSDSIIIYNTNNSTYVYQEVGSMIINESEINEIYFLRWNTGVIGKNIPCQLIKYNYITKKEQTLFTENDISKRPYWWGPEYIHLTSLTAIDSASNLFLKFELYKMKENAQEEDDFCKFEIIVDTSRKTYP